MEPRSKAVGAPPTLLRRAVRVLRPVDAADVYAHPRAELRRLVARGVLHRLAFGYYAIVPPDRIGDVTWQPSVEAAAWGVAAADYGVDHVALMGASAARVHLAIPRALSVTVVAVPKQRPALRLLGLDAEVLFVRRDVARLDVERTATEFGDGWVTTVEQTVLDLAARPHLGGLGDEVVSAIAVLLPRADGQLLEELATAQRRMATLRRLRVDAGA